MSDSHFPTAPIAEHQRPIGVSAHRIIAGRLPERLNGSLSTVEEIERELGHDE